VRLAHQAAIENDLITADVVEISEYPDLAKKYNVRGVPKTAVNETVFIEGAGSESMFLSKIKEAVGS
jgi:hypothetical protein